MISVSKRFAGLALAAIAATSALAACSSSSSSPSPSASSTTKPVSGGTLRIVAASGPAHLDTVPSYYTTDYQLTHAYTRQLLNYPTEPYTSTSDAGWIKGGTSGFLTWTSLTTRIFVVSCLTTPVARLLNRLRAESFVAAFMSPCCRVVKYNQYHQRIAVIGVPGE